MCIHVPVCSLIISTSRFFHSRVWKRVYKIHSAERLGVQHPRKILCAERLGAQHPRKIRSAERLGAQLARN